MIVIRAGSMQLLLYLQMASVLPQIDTSQPKSYAYLPSKSKKSQVFTLPFGHSARLHHSLSGYAQWKQAAEC